MPEAVIVAAARSPIGRASKGSLVECRPDDLTVAIETGTQADDEVEAIVRASESIPYLPDVPLNKLHIPKETPYERLPEIHVTSLFHIYI